MDLPRHSRRLLLGLLQFVSKSDNDEFRRPDRRNADFDDQAPFQHILGGHGLAKPHIHKICGFGVGPAKAPRSQRP